MKIVTNYQEAQSRSTKFSIKAQLGVVIFVILSFLGFTNQITNGTNEEKISFQKKLPVRDTISFKHLTLEDGLSQSSITSIIQDERGFMWFGTQSGLNRWDGNNFRIYKKVSHDAESISHNQIKQSLIDKDGNLWFATADRVLNKYNPQTDKFKRISMREARTFSFTSFIVMEDYNGNIWLPALNGTLHCYDQKNKTVISYTKKLKESLNFSTNNINELEKQKQSLRINACTIGRDNTIWIGTNIGLLKFNQNTKKFYHYESQNVLDLKTKFKSNKLNRPWVRRIREDKKGQIWIGTVFGGLQRLNPLTGEFVSYPFNSKDPTCFFGNSADLLFEDYIGRIWVNSKPFNQDYSFKLPRLGRINPVTGKIIRYEADPAIPGSLSQNNVIRLIEDSQNKLWMHTFGGGIDVFEPQSESFTHFEHDPKDSNSLGGNGIQSMYEDRGGTVWLGTESNGVSYFNPAWKKISHFWVNAYAPYRQSNQTVNIIEGSPNNIDKSGYCSVFWIGTEAGLNRWDRKNNTFIFNEVYPRIPDFIPKTIYEDKNKILWVGNRFGLFKIKTADFKNKGKFEFLNISKGNEIPTWIRTIKPGNNGHLWLGTFRQGLVDFDPATLKCAYFQNDPKNPESLIDNCIFELYSGRNGNLWIITRSGLELFNTNSQKFTHFYPEKVAFHSANIKNVYEASNGILWFGTDRFGLEKYDPKTNMAKLYTVSDGLPHNDVLGILSQKGLGRGEQVLWISTKNGLCRFDVVKESFQRFDRWDGLQSNEFVGGAAYSSPDGEMFFGGMKGFNAFFPPNIKNSKKVSSVIITDLKILNESIKTGENSVLKKPIEMTKSIQFSHTDRVISFEFSALDFPIPEKIQYAYFLEGFEKEWNYVNNRKYATYTSLPPGNYTFRVKATNFDGFWNEQSTNIDVKMISAPWRTWWAKILYVLFTFLIVFGFYSWRMRDLREQREKLKNQVEERTTDFRKARDAAENANRAKSLFLANMSHELRTPLNAVLGFSQLMLREKDLDSTSKLTPNQIENLEIIGHSGKHLLDLINDVLEMAKIEAGRVSLFIEDMDFFNMLENLENMFKLRAESKGIELKFIVEAGTPRFIRADEKKLDQILLNLIGNAIKFTSEGSIIIRSRYSDTYFNGKYSGLIIEIEDTGHGIPEDNIETIFNPFVQTEIGREAEGTGLGLPICRKFVRLMGGELEVNSKINQGSVFKFAIKVEESNSTDVGRPIFRKQVVKLINNGNILEDGPMRILVVDDVRVSRLLLVKLLTPVGFEVFEAGNGQEAVQVWRDKRPHLIWMDMRMPIMDGKEATKQIRQEESEKKTKIIALTASSFEEEKDSILANGCDDFIRKPFEEEEIFSVLEKHLGLNFEYQEFIKERSPGKFSMNPQSSEEIKNKDILIKSISRLSHKWRKELELASIKLDGEKTLDLIGQIEKKEPVLGKAMKNLNKEFRFDLILELLKNLEVDDEKK